MLPENTPKTKQARVLIEVRDVSMADAPSTIVAHEYIDKVALGPDREIPFQLSVPEVAPNRSLALRVHIDIARKGQVSAGDLLTTAHIPIAATGTQATLKVPVTLI